VFSIASTIYKVTESLFLVGDVCLLCVVLQIMHTLAEMGARDTSVILGLSLELQVHFN
jgi:hypothetical protein